MHRTINEIKEDLRTQFIGSDCYDLIKFYDYITESEFSSKVKEKKVNKNKYLDRKIRLAFEELIEKAKPSKLIDMWKFTMEGEKNTQQFFEYVDRQKAEEIGKFGSSMKTLLKKIEDNGFYIEVVEAQPAAGILSFEFYQYGDTTYMDFVQFLNDEWIDDPDSGDWDLIFKNGNCVVLSYKPFFVDLYKKQEKPEESAPYEKDIEVDYDTSMGKSKKYGDGVDPSKDIEVD